ncbi:MAG TPA: hypothetical protein VMS86_08425, partial [Thermoanaerobaculia bacterium]|nr:hypothetical protein [Thermoanaerobaculia bacterium]
MMSFEQVLRSPSAKRRGVLCLAAVVLAYAGQWILSSTPSPRRALAHGEPASVVAGTGLLLLGAILFLVAWHRQRDPDALTAMPAVPPRDARWWSLGMAALALWAGALWMQARHGETATMRAAWVASVSLLALAAWGSQRGQAGTPVIDAVPRRTALALLSVIGLGAFLLRFVELATLPLAHHGDMAMMGLGSRELLRGETGWFGVGWAWIPWLGYAPGALAMRLFGDDLFGLRMASVLGGTVAVVSTYGIGATIHSRRVGLLAAAVGAVGYVDIHFGRIPGYIDP